MSDVTTVHCSVLCPTAAQHVWQIQSVKYSKAMEHERLKIRTHKLHFSGA